MRKKILSVLVTLCLLIELAPTAFAAWSTNYTLTGNQAQDIVNIALAQKGKARADLGYSVNWCAMFISDCAAKAGASGAIPYSAGVKGILDNIISRGGQKVLKNNVQPGDVLAMNWSGGTSLAHVELVYAVKGSTVYSVSGNSGGGDGFVRTHTLQYGDSKILGVYRPNYSRAGTVPPTYSGTTTKPTVAINGSNVYVSWEYKGNGDRVDVYLIQEPWGWNDIKKTWNVESITTSVCFENVQPGYYQVFTIVRPNADTVQSEWTAFTVEAAQPPLSAGTTSKPTVSGNTERVSVNYSYDGRKGNATSIDVYLVDHSGAVQYSKTDNFNFSGAIIPVFTYFYNVEPGEYYVYTIARPNSDTVQSEWTAFTVESSQPPTSSGTTSQSVVSGNTECVTVSFSYSGSGTGVDVYLVNTSGEVKYSKHTDNPNGDTWVNFFNVEPGEYYAYTIVRPNDDSVQSTWTAFTVSPPHTTHVKGEYLRADTQHPHYNHWSCSACGEDFTDGSTTTDYTCERCHPEHTWDTGVITVKPTNDSDGEKLFTCTVCGATKTDVIPAIGIEPTPPSTKFADVSTGAYYFEPVSWAVSNGITSGTGGHKFSPHASCTRGQIVTFLWRAAGSPDPVSSANPFSDVKPSDYFYKAVLWAVENNITSGIGGGRFGPGGACTRGQAVTFLWRAEKSPNASAGSSFSDVKSGSYYEKAVDWAVSKNVTSGTGNGKFSPDASCTRGQIVTFLYRANG